MSGQEEFDAYVRERGPALFRIALLLVGDHHHAEDLVQEALMRTAAHWRRGVAGGDPHTYVRRVLYHQHISWWRRRTRRIQEARVDVPDPWADDRSDDVVVA